MKRLWCGLPIFRFFTLNVELLWLHRNAAASLAVIVKLIDI